MTEYLKENKFKVGQRAFMLNVGHKFPLTTDFVVNGVLINDEGIFYTEDNHRWIPEKSLFPCRKDAYKYLMFQCEKELDNLAYLR